MKGLAVGGAGRAGGRALEVGGVVEDGVDDRSRIK
jgi:hypothetical protein